MAQKRSILIVDDDVDASQMTKMILEKTGLYAVSVCNRGSEAYKIIQDTRPELVLLDVMMPDADGTDIAGRIQKDKSLALTQVVFMTSLVSQNEVLKHSVIGGHAFISKPITSEILLRRVKGFFEIGK
ncbi:MAG: response regulator [Candidatus Omnitrophica bacterium]|jgi:DNA-binding response OmpR family regulator|nr:response regulator [Candidatus Omnitrophota bacterium]